MNDFSKYQVIKYSVTYQSYIYKTDEFKIFERLEDALEFARQNCHDSLETNTLSGVSFYTKEEKKLMGYIEIILYKTEDLI